MVLLLGGVPVSDEVSEGGYQNFTVTPRGGYAFFTGTFPKKDHPPPLQEILSSPLMTMPWLMTKSQRRQALFFIEYIPAVSTSPNHL